jgi:hypothetical protein
MKTIRFTFNDDSTLELDFPNSQSDSDIRTQLDKELELGYHSQTSDQTYTLEEI